jgi:hypothetical protein
MSTSPLAGHVSKPGTESPIIQKAGKVPAPPGNLALDGSSQANDRDTAPLSTGGVPVDSAVARAYGQVYATVSAAGRRARGRRAFDLLIAATALAAGLPLYTRSPGDFRELVGLMGVVAVLG